MTLLDQLVAYYPAVNKAAVALGILAILYYTLAVLPRWVQKVRTWREYCASHTKFSLEAGQGRHLWLEDPFSLILNNITKSEARNYWLCHHEAIKYVFSRAAISQTDHRGGFDWFHLAGWEVPTTDPRYKATVRQADQTVHSRLAKSRLVTLLQAVQEIGNEQIDRIQQAVVLGDSSSSRGRVISLHTAMYRLGYNVNCLGIFGPQLDHVATRIVLQEFTEHQHVMFASFNWPLPLWLSHLVVPGSRKTVKARKKLFNLLLNWCNSGGIRTASPEMQAIVHVFEAAKTSPDISSKFLNMMMIAFLANTPETLGWLFTHLTQAPVLLQAIRAECDALLLLGFGSGSGAHYAVHSTNFKQATPHLYSALFETFRLYVFTGTPATVVQPCTLPGMGDHVFQPGDILHSMGEAAAVDVAVCGEDAPWWKGHRFVGEGADELLKYDLTFGIGRSPCPGRNFAIAELCMLAARMIQMFDFSEPHLTKRLAFDDGDWVVGPRVETEGRTVQIIDLDGKMKSIIHPGNASDKGLPGMTAANIPIFDFACRLTPRQS